MLMSSWACVKLKFTFNIWAGVFSVCKTLDSMPSIHTTYTQNKINLSVMPKDPAVVSWHSLTFQWYPPPFLRLFWTCFSKQQILNLNAWITGYSNYYVTCVSKECNVSMLQYPPLKMRIKHGVHTAGLTRGLYENIHVKSFEEFLAHNRCSINIAKYCLGWFVFKVSTKDTTSLAYFQWQGI